MKAVFRHELSSYFTNITGYVFGAFLLLFVGIFTMIYNINYSVSNYEYVLGNMSFVFLIIVPVLTMRAIAEERKQKTDQLLYSLPLTMTQVVIGKYTAMICVLAIPMIPICMYPLVLSIYGNVYLPAAFGSIVGFFFLGAALIAIGTFVSSLTESQPIAAGICFVVMLVNYYLYDLAGFVSQTAGTSLAAFSAAILVISVLVRYMTKNGLLALCLGVAAEGGLLAWYFMDKTAFEGLFPEIIRQLSLFERFYIFIDGIFDITGIIYFLSVIGVFLFLTVQAMDKRRWS